MYLRQKKEEDLTDIEFTLRWELINAIIVVLFQNNKKKKYFL